MPTNIGPFLDTFPLFDFNKIRIIDFRHPIRAKIKRFKKNGPSDEFGDMSCPTHFVRLGHLNTRYVNIVYL